MPRRSAPSTASRYVTAWTRSWPIQRSTRSSSRTPHSEHGPQVERAAAAGKHVFMEKPFTLDRKSAARALDAVARAGVTLGVALSAPLSSRHAELKARIDDARLGNIAHCSSEQNGPAALGRGDFMEPALLAGRSRRSAGRGHGPRWRVHNLDAMIHLFGPIDEVYASSLKRTITYGAEDTTSVMFGFANGMSGVLMCCLATAVSYRLAAFGSKGCAELVTPEMDFRFTPIPDADAGRAAHPAGAGSNRASRL